MAISTIEGLRKEELGTVAAWVLNSDNKLDDRRKVTFFYQELATQAHYFTWQAIELFESESSHFSRPKSGAVPVILWYAAIEAYINALLKIACLVRNSNFNSYKGKDINTRLTGIFKEFDINPETSKKLGMWSRLNEFSQFRNEVLHDRYTNKPLSFNHTLFSNNPYLSNQSDDVQASLIANEIFSALRYIVPSIDFMPNILINGEDCFSWEKSDLVHEEITKKYFASALKKHEITSDLIGCFDKNLHSVGPSKLVTPGKVHIFMAAKITAGDLPAPSREKTRIGLDIMNSFCSSVKVEPGKFRVGNYYTR